MISYPSPFRYDDLRSVSVLVIDPDVELLAFLQRWLAPANCIVDGCASGQEGLAMSRQKSYDLILLEAVLPDMDGFDLYQQLRREGVSLLLLTGQPLSLIAQRAHQSGVSYAIQKPFVFSELLISVERACGRVPDARERRYPFLRFSRQPFVAVSQEQHQRSTTPGTFPCPHCGAELSQGDNFCLTCGRRVEE